jgi:NAD(P)-dependent dehydrogenase (short-subunit alcohol dehydrogenase family)
MSEPTVDMADRVVLVTGGTGGIGKATATALARMGATTVVVGRDEERGQAAVDDIGATTGNDDVTFLSADLSVLAEVQTLAATVRERFDRLDVLVNNAGTLGAKRQETADGYERTFAVNVLSPFLLTHELRPLLEASAPSRVVNVNTQSVDLPWPFAGYATPDLDDLQLESGYNGMKAYVRSKTANLAWTYELADRFEGSGVTVYAVNPGGADTGLQRESQRAAPLPIRVLGTALGPVLMRYLNTSVQEAAYSSIYAATAPELAGTTGLYLDPTGNPTSSSTASRDDVMAEAIWEHAIELTGANAEDPTVERAESA